MSPLVRLTAAGSRCGCAKACDAGDVLGAGSRAALLAAATKQRIARQTLPPDERADTGRSSDLVPRNRHKIGAQNS